MKVKQLNLYPVKSTQPHPVLQVFVHPEGLAFDREFMITETDGKFITARKDSVLYQFKTYPYEEGVVIEYNGERCEIRYSDFEDWQSCEVWNSAFPSMVANAQINQKVSEWIGRPVQVRWLGDETKRSVSADFSQPLNFSDSKPVLLISEKSFEQVQAWSPTPISIEQFRSNIVIDGLEQFAEEGWKSVKIGEVEFRVERPCTRCMLITRNPQTFELDPASEPLRALKKKHTDSHGKPIFGVYLIPQGIGIIKLGDDVEPLE